MSAHDNTYDELVAMVESLCDEMTVADALSGRSVETEMADIEDGTSGLLGRQALVLQEWADDEDLVEEWFADGISLSNWLNARVIDWVEHAQRRPDSDAEWTTTHFDATFCTGGPAIWAEIHEGYAYIKGVWGTDTITRTLPGNVARNAFEDMAEVM